VFVNQQYANILNQEFMKAGLRGLTLLFASGDSGVGTRNLLNPAYPFCEKFVATFPASSPYVTAVGATQWSNRYTPICEESNNCSDVKEIACMSDRGGGITTGGGFSAFFPMPDYQKNVVNSYLNSPTSKLPPFTAFNPTGRAYPDISVVGSNFVIFYKGKYEIISGTSASTPTFAAMISLLNNARLNAGKKSLGFINPWLYQLYETNPSSFNDIVIGNNKCSDQYQSLLFNYYCCANGFYAAPGYDTVTGLGSPQFEKFYTATLEDTNNQKAPRRLYILWIVLSIFLVIALIVAFIVAKVLFRRWRKQYSLSLQVPLNDVNMN
jgi:tripeptidyl-peptidase-1